MDTVVCKEVVITTLSRRGQGVAGDPVRVITEVFEKDGTLIAEHDPHTFTINDLVSFADWCISKKYHVNDLKLSTVHEWNNKGRG